LSSLRVLIGEVHIFLFFFSIFYTKKVFLTSTENLFLKGSFLDGIQL